LIALGVLHAAAFFVCLAYARRAGTTTTPPQDPQKFKKFSATYEFDRLAKAPTNVKTSLSVLGSSKRNRSVPCLQVL
jgi:hypothetical protein